MQKRYFVVSAFVLLMLVVAVYGYTVSSSSTEEPTARLLLDNAGGRVVFTHQKHIEEYGFECADCHHNNVLLSCGTCHGVPIDEAFKADHVQAFTNTQASNDEASCVVCHHKSVSGLVWDHDAHNDAYGLSCIDCHHEDTSIEPEPTNCGDCHEPATPTNPGTEAFPDLKTAVHTKCMTCHDTDFFAAGATGCASCHSMRDNPEAFNKGETNLVTPADANCATCHTEQPSSELILPRMDAFHGLCMGCHEALDVGPYQKDQCNQCHLK